MSERETPAEGDGALSRRHVLALASAAVIIGTAGGWPVAAAAPGPGDPARRFADPRPDSRPTVLWFWNGTVTTDLVTAGLADLLDKGIHEVLVFPFDTAALKPAFFTEDWFTLIEFTLREAQRHGMHLWLFNDDYFPSGRAGGLVVDGGKVGDRNYQPRPDLRLKGVGHQVLTVTGGVPVPLVSRGLSVTDGRLLVDAAARDGVTLLREGGQWQDYDVVAKVRVESATAGLMVRSAGEGDGVLADLRSDGAVDVWQQTGGAFSLARSGSPVPGFDPAADHELVVRVRGTTLTVSLDGAAQAPADLRYAIGRVGVRAVATQRSSWDSLTVRDPDGRVLYAETFDSAAALDAFDLPATGVPLVAAAARPESSTDPASLIDLTGQARAGGTWTPPTGRWRLDLFTVRPLSTPTGTGRAYLDLLDDEAVRLFMDAVPGEYVRRFPWAAGAVLRGFADDEPYLASADGPFNTVPWSPTLDAELRRLGTAPGLALTAVHDNDLGPAGLRLRGVFWRAVSNRFAAAYYRNQGRWMAEHGLKMISNPLWDEYGPGEQLRSSGNLNTTNQWAQVPGTDLIFDHYQRGYHRTLSRWPASTAHQLGLERVYLEAMGGTGWAVTPALVREVVGAFAVRGVNHTLLHARFSDENQIVYPPPFQPANPWWPVSTPLNDWIGRLMEACRAPAKAQTALLQPQRAVESTQDTLAMAALDTAFLTTAHALEDVQVDFDFLDEGALDADPALVTHARPSGPRLVVGQQAYRIVVVPPTPVLAIGSVRTLIRFVRGGGTVIVVGEPPAREAGGNDMGLRAALTELFTARSAVRVADPAAAAAATATAGGAAAVLEPRHDDVRVLRLEGAGGATFVVLNERAEAVDLTATFPATGVPEVWDPDTGSVAPAGVWRRAPFGREPRGGTAVVLRLEPKATLLVVFRAGPEPAHAVSASAPVERVRIDGRTATATVRVTGPGPVTVTATEGGRAFSGTATVSDPLTAVPLGGDWALHFDRAGAPVSTRPLGSWTELDAAYSGSAWYETDVEVTALAGRRWTLDLGEVHEVAELEVNGKPFGSRLWPPYRFDVTTVLRPGHNRIRVRVTNTGANTRGQTVASGLFGPVTLRPHLLVDVALNAR
ncbi:glycoside hydrolase [Amycolatopsis mediterranei S699]|uniref:Glycoside hydrolase family protein n=2 Tax=Amycolatopsis mediterranei TaxID=33910 RepID=A0A0H3D3A3_AMYMU|nr:glycosyl hydrolase [Amycolatopsis mediterranei]ADJ45445.1 glycoside hydrolase family protein [Amycolatopsis mediterranei U32]AFO77157.1 glycoside hydrolase [Amycolatopsis mediterranei S699]AGT84285.1 glycoside hydrolase [Amycolatopsis mediterranei RB]KDO06025.1 glycoside hydrolase [Amycolatopsis mediterranei]KDU88834.1 glycoside hydrolase [Amycolatopsis mediterranei]